MHSGEEEGSLFPRTEQQLVPRRCSAWAGGPQEVRGKLESGLGLCAVDGWGGVAGCVGSGLFQGGGRGASQPAAAP